MANPTSRNNSSVDANDPFEEFEFKPLTEGLGFHKGKEPKNLSSANVTASKLEFRNSNLNFQNQSVDLAESLPKVSAKNRFPTGGPAPEARQIQVPLIEDDSISKAQSAVNEILKNLNHKKQQEAQQRNKLKFDWKNTAPSLAAALLDAMFVVAFFLVCMICLLTVTKVDLVANFANPGQNAVILWATVGLFFFTSFTYMTLFRTYMGYTPGEWAFDQRCGTDTDQASANYVPKVALRSLLVAITGFLPLTFVSWIFNFDFVGQLIKLPLQKRTA